MAWQGYFAYNGTEIVNAARTETYAHQAGAGWFKGCLDTEGLPEVLDDRYASPLQDDAPWTDPDDLNTYDFYGCYPLDVVGIEDATPSANVTESTQDGGTVGRVRRTTKPVVFTLMLLGGHDAAVEAGFRWLKRVLAGGPCYGRTDVNCNDGIDLCYFGSKPVEGCGEDTLRTLRQVTVTTGPNIIAKNLLTDDSEVWTVTFTAVAGNPFEYGIRRPIVRGFMLRDNPYVPPIVGDWDPDGFVEEEVDCRTAIYVPPQNPECVAVIDPPGVPDVITSCFKKPQNVHRRTFTIPQESVPLWGDVVPYITIRAKSEKVTWLRIRFYANTVSLEDDPCAHCGDIVFSWIPKGATITFDAAEHQVWLNAPGFRPARADYLVFKSNGHPFEWPELTCGFGYTVAVDLEQTAKPPVLDLALYPRAI